MKGYCHVQAGKPSAAILIWPHFLELRVGGDRLRNVGNVSVRYNYLFSNYLQLSCILYRKLCKIAHRLYCHIVSFSINILTIQLPYHDCIFIGNEYNYNYSKFQLVLGVGKRARNC